MALAGSTNTLTEGKTNLTCIRRHAKLLEEAYIKQSLGWVIMKLKLAPTFSDACVACMTNYRALIAVQGVPNLVNMCRWQLHHIPLL